MTASVYSKNIADVLCADSIKHRIARNGPRTRGHETAAIGRRLSRFLAIKQDAVNRQFYLRGFAIRL